MFSGIINILGFTAPLFMLEVYDRAIPSGSVPTLVALMLLAGGLYAFSGLLDIVRGRTMTRIAGTLDAKLTQRVFTVLAGSPLRLRNGGDALKPVQEADQIRAFLAGSGPTALFDLPWMPVYLCVCFLLHPLIGWLAAGAMVVLTGLTILTDWQTRSLTRQAAAAVERRNRYGEASHANAEAMAAMGMTNRAAARWDEAHWRVTTIQCQIGDIAGLYSGMSKTVRYMVQSGSLALGAFLVIQGDMSAGSIVAASIIVSRALSPIEQVIGNWKTLLAARQAWHRLKEAFVLFPEEQPRTTLPPPSSSLTVEAVFTSPPGERRMTVQNVSFRADRGTVIGIIGPSASGKSTLARAITGVWPLARGAVRLDNASPDQRSDDERGRHIGYMPQSSNLLPGTIADNIARLEPEPDHAAIIAAAQAAGVHEMIVGLPNGYETEVGDGGLNLSGGQRQRIALARALYRDPFLIVLDEPNSNLDGEGDLALAKAIAGVRARGGIVLVVAHRSNILSLVDFLLVMENGVAKAFGPRDAILKSIQQRQLKPARTTPGPALTVIDGEGA
ncbi:type I secretion system permease/ATPase [Rhizobium leguminosarum]|nr:type I secretion system permease/ATPase [Rhizobium leguminosarum]NKM03666.1 type I secretion system permease/ATPase [Rhizobium leguminosarum bv. viciae]